MALVEDCLDWPLMRNAPAMQNSSKAKPLYVVADLLALAILRKFERENGRSQAKELDFADGRSVCVNAKELFEENAL